MKTAEDLNEILFETIDRLSDPALDGEKLEMEIGRSEAIQKVAKQIVDNGVLALKAAEFMVENGAGGGQVALPLFTKE